MFIGRLLPTQTSRKARSQQGFEIVLMVFAHLKMLTLSSVDEI